METPVVKKNTIRKALYWALFCMAFVPAIYADATITPSQNAKTLFLRFCMMIVSILFAYRLATEKSFFVEVRERVVTLWKHPIVRWVLIGFGILVVSTIFAYSKYFAFLGEVERDEGLLGLTFFYAFFVYAVILFRQKDWYTFFWLTLSTQIVIFFAAVYQSNNGLVRVNSVLGNPIYFAVYALITFCLSWIVWIRAKKQNAKVAQYTALTLVGISLIEIFLANTRSIFFGVVVAIPFVLLYAVLQSEKLFPNIQKKRVRKITLSLFIGSALFLTAFFSTRHASIWSYIPGLNRIAESSMNDSNMQARFVSWSIAVHSVNPATAGITRTLVGWGWDNYLYAWQQFYNPHLYQFDPSSFDRPHNKLLDMLTMNGVFGLAAYLILWLVVLRAIIGYGKREPAVALVLLFWAIAFFVQNIFAFDSIVSWILFFALIGFIVTETTHD
jgi:hypothetical protein